MTAAGCNNTQQVIGIGMLRAFFQDFPQASFRPLQLTLLKLGDSLLEQGINA